MSFFKQLFHREPVTDLTVAAEGHGGESSQEVTRLSQSDATVSTSRVTMYTTSWCGSCRMAKRFFQQQGVEYDEIDIEEVPEAAEQVMQWARGYKTVPTMKIGDTIVVDWDRKAVAAALAKEGLV